MVRVAMVVLAALLPCACGGQTHQARPTDGPDAGGAGGAGVGGAGDGAPSGAPDASRDGRGEWRPPPGPYDCETHPPPTPEKGNGQCVPPPAAVAPFCSNACWDSPGAPGPEGCRPSAADEFGSRCCVPGVCGFDFGNGCTSALELTDETVVAASPCAPPSATPEHVFEGRIDQAVVTENAVLVASFNGLHGTVAYVAKKDCAARQVYSGASVRDAVVAGDMLYVIGTDAASGNSSLLLVSPTGEVKPVSLAGLFGEKTVGLSALAAAGTTVYVSALATDSGFSNANRALVEIPCCGSAPRLVAEGLSEWMTLGGSIALLEGQTLVVGDEQRILDVGTRSAIGVFDFTTLRARLFFDVLDGAVRPLALQDGRLYLVRGSAIVSMGVADCSVTTIAERPKALSITALAVDRGDVFWAETYDGLLGARIFVKRADGTEVRLAQVNGAVTWLGVDSQTIYWVMARETAAGNVLVRRLRP